MGVTVRSVTSMTRLYMSIQVEESLDFDELLKLRKKYRIEAILVSDTGDDNLVLQIDIRTDEQRQFDKEVGEELLSQNCER